MKEEYLKALKLERGSVYAIELDRPHSTENIRHLQQYFSGVGAELGIRFIILDPGMRIARQQIGWFAKLKRFFQK